MVTAFLGHLDEWLQAPAPTFKARFIEDVREYKAGVSLACRTTLSLERDLYLNDHVYQGSAVLPGVLALEAMAQASAFALGVKRPSFVRCDDIVFGRAIVVDPKRGAEIELRALVEELPVDGTRRIHTAIRAAESGYQVECARATFVIGTLSAGTMETLSLDEPLGIEPLRDVYGTILFHGPAYQRIREVYSLDSEVAVAAVEISEASALGHGVFAEGESRTLLLGDPFFRDATWQVGQLSYPRKLCLPLGIRSLEFFLPAPYDAGRYVTTRRIGERERELFGSGQLTDRQGRILERTTEFHARVMQERPDVPSVDELASIPRTSIVRKIELAQSVEDVERTLKKFGSAAPTLWWVRDPSLASKRGTERRQAEQEHLECALERYAEQNALSNKSVAIIWVASERPELLGLDYTNLDACYDGEYFLCVVGLGIQACDLRPVVERSEQTWMELLGQTKASLVLELMDDLESHQRIATRVQSAHEAARAAAHSDDVQIHNGRRDGPLVLFDAITPEGGMVIATLPLRLGDTGVEHVCAVIVERDAKIEGGRRESRLYVDPEAYRTRMTLDGPERQPVLEQRSVVSFREAASLSRTVLFPQYAFWMGKLREQSTYNVNTELMEQLTSGDWGMVTNRAEVRVFNELLGGDVLQARIWASEVVRSSVTMACEFHRVAAEGRLEPVAFGEQQITWVRFGGHGDASSADFPAYMQRLIKLAGPRVARQPSELYSRERAIARGATLYRRHGLAKHVLHSDEFQTTLEDANLVGNIYFANYFNWQLRCRDLLSHAVAPSYLRGTGSRGDWGCLRAKMTFLRDGMPFDRLRVRMSARALYECGADLEFEFLRVDRDGREEKLAIGEQDLVWARRVDRELRPIPLPLALRTALRAGSEFAADHLDAGSSDGAAAE
jgi:acyl-CoA thioesterase FadM/3-hydroxymyristoyl/3-hydroxydecanoyl-(acyl carrier protein) dehydratase